MGECTGCGMPLPLDSAEAVCPSCASLPRPMLQEVARLRPVSSMAEKRQAQDDRVVAILESALTEARKGKLVGIILVGVEDPPAVAGTYAGRNLLTAVGELESTKMRLLIDLAMKTEKR